MPCVKAPGIDEIMRYEDGQLSEDETVDFFQRLTDSGLVWSLQGSYGRTAARLIDQGLISGSASR